MEKTFLFAPETAALLHDLAMRTGKSQRAIVEDAVLDVAKREGARLP